jgi:hypothetical protein
MAAKKERGVEVTIDKTADVAAAIKRLTKTKVLVGFPQSTSRRDEGKLSNAELAYIHENGAPEVNIPARPFLVPGVRKIQDTVTVPGFKKAGQLAFAGDWAGAERTLGVVGQKAADSARDTITAGLEPPLKPGTVAGRLRRLAGYQKAGSQKRSQMLAQALTNAKPLIDTGQLMRAITWVIRKL